MAKETIEAQIQDNNDEAGTIGIAAAIRDWENRLEKAKISSDQNNNNNKKKKPFLVGARRLDATRSTAHVAFY